MNLNVAWTLTHSEASAFVYDANVLDPVALDDRGRCCGVCLLEADESEVGSDECDAAASAAEFHVSIRPVQETSEWRAVWPELSAVSVMTRLVQRVTAQLRAAQDAENLWLEAQRSARQADAGADDLPSPGLPCDLEESAADVLWKLLESAPEHAQPDSVEGALAGPKKRPVPPWFKRPPTVALFRCRAGQLQVRLPCFLTRVWESNIVCSNSSLRYTALCARRGKLLALCLFTSKLEKMAHGQQRKTRCDSCHKCFGERRSSWPRLVEARCCFLETSIWRRQVRARDGHSSRCGCTSSFRCRRCRLSSAWGDFQCFALQVMSPRSARVVMRLTESLIVGALVKVLCSLLMGFAAPKQRTSRNSELHFFCSPTARYQVLLPNEDGRLATNVDKLVSAATGGRQFVLRRISSCSVCFVLQCLIRCLFSIVPCIVCRYDNCFFKNIEAPQADEINGPRIWSASAQVLLDDVFTVLASSFQRGRSAAVDAIQELGTSIPGDQALPGTQMHLIPYVNAPRTLCFTWHLCNMPLQAPRLAWLKPTPMPLLFLRRPKKHKASWPQRLQTPCTTTTATTRLLPSH